LSKQPQREPLRRREGGLGGGVGGWADGAVEDRDMADERGGRARREAASRTGKPCSSSCSGGRMGALPALGGGGGQGCATTRARDFPVSPEVGSVIARVGASPSDVEPPGTRRVGAVGGSSDPDGSALATARVAAVSGSPSGWGALSASQSPAGGSAWLGSISSRGGSSASASSPPGCRGASSPVGGTNRCELKPTPPQSRRASQGCALLRLLVIGPGRHQHHPRPAHDRFIALVFHIQPKGDRTATETA